MIYLLMGTWVAGYLTGHFLTGWLNYFVCGVSGVVVGLIHIILSRG